LVVYNYQGKRVRTITESNHQVQSQRDYLPSLDLSINQAKQQTSTLHIGTHIAFLLHLSFVFASDEGSATIGVVMFVTEDFGFIVEF
jgi:hypothetical protein